MHTIKNTLLALYLLSLSSSSFGSQEVYFTGQVANTTCIVSSHDLNASLPETSVEELKIGESRPWGYTFMQGPNTECPISGWLVLGYNVTPNGYLGNMISENEGGAKNVSVKITDNKTGDFINFSNQNPYDGRDALYIDSHNQLNVGFHASMISDGGNPTAGIYKGMLSYVFTYD